MLNRELLKEKLRATKKEIDEALEDLEKDRDEELDNLQRIQADFTPHGRKECKFYTLIRIMESPYSGMYTFEVSDGFARLSGGAKTPEEGMERAVNEAWDNFVRNKENGWLHNDKN